MNISIVIPVLNEANGLPGLLARLGSLREMGHEIIVVDGGSDDASVEVARSLADQVVESGTGRALQMNQGAAVSQGDLLWFLHADSFPSDEVLSALQQLKLADQWGRFDVSLSGDSPWLRMVGWFMNRRSCLTGICTGDQGIFVTKRLFYRVGGFPEIALMEDVAISASLKRITSPLCMPQRLVTSSRRWEGRGVLTTILLMWSLRLRFFFGSDPERLKRIYYGN